MLLSGIPAKFQIPFGNSAGAGYIRSIPVLSQIGITNGAASLTDGFPPLNFVPTGAGGVPPFGQDMNGLLNQMSAWTRWQNAGAPIQYDATFQTNIGGYPQGAVVMSGATLGLFWLSLVDNNATNPDTGGSGWVGFSQFYFGNDGGSADALTATLCTTYAQGQFFLLRKGSSANATTTPTFNPGSGAKTIIDRRGNALAAGDLPGSAELMLFADGTGYRNLGVVAADVAALVSSVFGTPFVQVGAGSGNYTPAAGVGHLRVLGVAPGGGGGGSNNSTGGGTIIGNGGGGGGGGSGFEAIIACTPGTPIPWSMGNVGQGVVNNSGTTGGSLVFGSVGVGALVTATGGIGGPFGSNTLSVTGSGGTVTSSGTNLLSILTSIGGTGAFSGTNDSGTPNQSEIINIYARGGQAPFLSVTSLVGTGTGGLGYGSGGAGATGGSGLAGGDGASGFLMIEAI